MKWGRLEEAERLLQEALTIWEHAFGAEHPNVAPCHSWLGSLCYKQSDHSTAVDHYRKALAIEERTLGPNHPNTVTTREWLAIVEAG